MRSNLKLIFLAFTCILLLIGLTGWMVGENDPGNSDEKFHGDRAYNDVTSIMDFGPRTPNSVGHKKTIDYIQRELKKSGWSSTVLSQVYNGHVALNIIATRNDEDPMILLGAHYDSRIFADNDPIAKNRKHPVPGANDGASGVALLLELARILPINSIPTALLFIDIEDNGRIPGWDWIQGSQAFAANMDFRPQAVIIVDMIGDASLNIMMERNSDQELTDQIWETAKELGYESVFIPKLGHRVIDDHMPFINRGIRAVDIIDLDYRYWHSLDDTADKVSAISLQKVGDTLLVWIKKYGPCLNSPRCNPN